MRDCLFVYFFSSRRRHTRCSRDWSSDVCSSDLCGLIYGGVNMLLGKSKAVSPVSQKRRFGGHSARTPRLCPKTGRPLNSGRKYRGVMWVFPILGLFSLIWFLIRVIPKPSRATYPCQRFAAPFASGFVIWIAGMIGSVLAYRRAKRFLH